MQELEWELEALEDEMESPARRRVRAAAPTQTSCPTPAQVARDRCLRPGTQTCPPIPNLLCLREVSGLPFEYVEATGTDQATGLLIITRRRAPVTQRFIPAIRDALNDFIGNMNRFGMGMEAILTLGSLYCRCVTGTNTLSNHSFGDAVDVAGVRWAATGSPASRTRETIVHNWRNSGQRALLRRINACLRLSFNTVIDYHRSDHRDHFHCDTNSRAGSVRAMGRSTTTPHFTQEALTIVLGRPVPETGNWDRVTMQALRDYSGIPLSGPRDPRMNDVLNQLFTQIASGVAATQSAPMGLEQFPFDSAALLASHGRLIEHLARRIVASFSGGKPVRAIRVIGHTDSRGPAAYNHGLGLRRARAVARAVAQRVERLRPGAARRVRFLTASRGATRPIAPSSSPMGRARNRRVSVSLDGPSTQPATQPARQAESLEFERAWEMPGPVSASVPTPPKLYSETSVPNETQFVTIKLESESPAPPMTAIFVPKDYKKPAQIDLVLWLQGHHNSPPKYPRELSIDRYLDAAQYPHFAFREGVNASNKNVIFVAPTLGYNSQAGNLIKRDGLAWYIDQVLAALKAYSEPFRSMSELPPLDNIIVACHSGGGAPMRQIANTPQKYLDKIQQFWGFDCLYNKGDEQAWFNWARSNADKKLFIRYGNGGTAEKSRKLKVMARRLSNVSVDGSESLGHNQVPITHWTNFLRAASFLQDK